ncbi:MAG: LuxR C-terminal-related transcriptional regulator, partial [Bacteroidota bacterium]
FSALYIYKNKTITVLDPSFVVSDMIVFGEELIVGGGQKGLYRLSKNTLIPLAGQEPLEDKTMTDMAVIQDKLLVGTKLQGCFIYDGQNLRPWEEEINQDLKRYQLNKILLLNSGEYVFGTIKNGLYLYDPTQRKARNINRKKGLQNNTVLSLSQFQEQLWVGLDNGLDRLYIDNPITYYTDYTGTLGTVYDISVHENIIYLGSNTGIYNLTHDVLKFVPGSQGHVWDLEVAANELLAGHNTGTFKVTGTILDKIYGSAGGYHLVKVPEKEDTFLQGTYTGLAKYGKTETGIWEVTRMKGLGDPVKQLCFEDPNTVWAAHPYKGLSRFTLDDALTTVLETREFGTEIIPNTYNIKLYNVKNQIVIQSGGLWYKYNPITEKIMDFKEFEPYRNKDLIYNDGSHFWFLDRENGKELSYTDLKKRTISIAEPTLAQRLIPDAENLFKLNDSLYFLTLSDGFGRINIAQLSRRLAKFTIPSPKLAYFKDEKGRLPLDDSLSLTIPFRFSQEIHLQVSAPSVVQPRYHYELKGPAPKSYMSHKGTVDFQNLPHGDYRLNIYTLSMDNTKSPPLVVRFIIAPPWYLSNLSIITYVLGLIGLFFLVRHYNQQKLKRKHKKLKTQLQQEQKELLAALEKEKLEKEIQEKQKELARTTMSVAKKNELILELKEMLLLHRKEFSNKQRYRSLTKKLERSINGDEDWRHFEVNFKELHGDFFENLLQKYPDLTPKDLKLCAYLKMNLSSKEIAPLMGISIRGVEIHRYRLRKKLNMNSSQNLSNFLIKFN